jgi:DNA-binding transcriptional regulator YdaS (Cro superfamily)|tara:strand:+ start:546 stop:764 length:219 start_codon:yes stop_codon:yes gene_type:complete
MKQTLDTHLAREGAPSLTALAAKVGVSKGRLSQLRHSNEWPPELAMAVEKATGGELDAGELSPIVAQARKPV